MKLRSYGVKGVKGVMGLRSYGVKELWVGSKGVKPNALSLGGMGS